MIVEKELHNFWLLLMSVEHDASVCGNCRGFVAVPLSRTVASLVALQILVVPDNLYKCPNKIINNSNIQITTSVVRLLIPFAVHRFGKNT
jgi:hypothetical protein